ncbi:MAG: NAD(+)/NADH kinase [Puniceicoccales bacterium]|jgi:NAD+ kinase|nr:NAD(+)/NADH kinase [Puniceicoccales bacterium]
MSSIRRLAIVANHTKSGVPKLAAELARVAESLGVTAIVPKTYPLPEGVLDACDACAVLGGDGTLLGVVGQAVAAQVPVFGINRGKLGFLAYYPSENAAESLRAVLLGEYQIVERTLLECRAQGGPPVVALNDVVFKTQAYSHMARLRVRTDEEFINSYRCDGLIVTTPTGSTAYNLSAGGPIIDPNADVFGVTPICPHTLSDRSLIFPRGTVITVEDEEKRGALTVTVDGVQLARESATFPVAVSLATQKMLLIQPRGLSHFELLRNKLRLA